MPITKCRHNVWADSSGQQHLNYVLWNELSIYLKHLLLALKGRCDNIKSPYERISENYQPIISRLLYFKAYSWHVFAESQIDLLQSSCDFHSEVPYSLYLKWTNLSTVQPSMFSAWKINHLHILMNGCMLCMWRQPNQKLHLNVVCWHFIVEDDTPQAPQKKTIYPFTAWYWK